MYTLTHAPGPTVMLLGERVSLMVVRLPPVAAFQLFGLGSTEGVPVLVTACLPPGAPPR